jgi:hypothetical protein
MHKYQKLNYVALTILLGVSASASAKSFPQDYLNTNHSLGTVQSVLAGDNKANNNGSSVDKKSLASPYHIHELTRAFSNKSDIAEITEKTIEMTDAKSTSNFHLFEQYL